MLFIPLVFLGKDLFEPVGLTVSYRFVDGSGRLIDDEVVTACIAPQDPHSLKIGSRLISREVSLYGHCFHLLNFSRACRLVIGALFSLLTLLHLPGGTEGLSQFSHDDEQGADHADEDRNEG
jgi:hypothetical protein